MNKRKAISLNFQIKQNFGSENCLKSKMIVSNPISISLFPNHIRGNIEDVLAGLGVVLQIVSNTILVTLKVKKDGKFEVAKEMAIPNDIYGISYSVVVTRLFEMFKAQIDDSPAPSSIGFKTWYRSHRYNGFVLDAWRDQILGDAKRLGLECTADGADQLEKLYNSVCKEKVRQISNMDNGVVLDEVSAEDFLADRRPCKIKKSLVADVIVKTINDYVVNEVDDYYVIDSADSGNFPWLQDFDFSVGDLGTERKVETKDGGVNSEVFVDDEVHLFENLWYQPPEENITVKISHSKRAIVSPAKQVSEDGCKIEEVIFRYRQLFKEHKLDISPAKFLISRRGSFIYHGGILRLKPIAAPSTTPRVVEGDGGEW